MYNSKFIQIRKDRSVEQRLASIWLDACLELEIPCILIYESHWQAYLTLELKYLPETLAQGLDPEDLKQQLAAIQEKYTAGTSGFYQHNATYFTFDAIPLALARQAATEIFDLFFEIAQAGKPRLVLRELQEQPLGV